ncbi:24307_t:CDS:1, partial [Dentiscutata erythropus]
IAVYLCYEKIYSKFLTKAEENLGRFGKSVNDIIEKLKRHKEGSLNKSVSLYQVGSHKYSYNSLDESRQEDVYLLFKTNQENK